MCCLALFSTQDTPSFTPTRDKLYLFRGQAAQMCSLYYDSNLLSMNLQQQAGCKDGRRLRMMLCAFLLRPTTSLDPPADVSGSASRLVWHLEGELMSHGQ